jgi:hypothetical protein
MRDILRSYDPKLVVVAFATGIITGFGKDIFISAELDEDGFTTDTGVDGGVVLSVNNNESATMKMTLFHTSPSNDFLAAAYLKHRLTGIIPGIFTIKDLSGRSLVNARNAWIKKLPPWQRGKTVGEVEWNLGTDKLDLFPGGN